MQRLQLCVCVCVYVVCVCVCVCVCVDICVYVTGVNRNATGVRKAKIVIDFIMKLALWINFESTYWP